MMNNGTGFRSLVCGLGCLTYCVTAVCDDADAPTSRTARAHLAAQVNRNVAAGSRTLAEVTPQSKYLDADARTELEQIVNSVRSAGQRLRSALNQLRSALEDEWPGARAALAANYETFSHGDRSSRASRSGWILFTAA